MSTKPEQLRELASKCDAAIISRPHFGRCAEALREFADRLDAVAVSDEVAQNAYVVFANLHPRLRDGWIHDYDIDVPAMRAALESVLPIADEKARDAWLDAEFILIEDPNDHDSVETPLQFGIATGQPPKARVLLHRAVASAKGDDNHG